MQISFTGTLLSHLNSQNQQLCCQIDEKDYTYADFSAMVGAIQNRMLKSGSEHIGIIADNSVETYAAIVAAWLTGKAYVPINPDYPKERLAQIIATAEITEIFYSQFTPEQDAFKQYFGNLEFIQCNTLSYAVPFNSYPSHNKTAYILFTSGTTGIPKGVPITFGNIQTFLNGFIDAGYQIEAKDRFLQMFELTFDLSVMCFLVPLTHSASFFPLPGGMIRTLGLYHILESCSVTVSLMVPSAINMLLPYLGDIHLPELKYSLFCGEALKTNLVDQWKQCVPNARIDNVYGPTEATIFCTIQQINREHPEADSMNGVCNIGLPMSGVDALIFSEGKEVHENMVSGELCLCGNQVTPGYLKNDLQNQQRFFKYNGVDFYKTGDLVSRNEKGTLVYLGRLDDQVKIQGFRVELAELEVAATHILPEHMSVAVGFTDATGNTRLALFVKELKSEPEWVRDQISGMIPDYMVPHLVLEIDDFPLNNNGKTDKNKLKQLALGYM